MTREEAITELELFKKSALVWNEMHLSESIDMAIEALQQEKCSSCQYAIAHGERRNHERK